MAPELNPVALAKVEAGVEDAAEEVAEAEDALIEAPGAKDDDAEACELTALAGSTTPPSTLVGTTSVALAAAKVYTAMVSPPDLRGRKWCFSDTEREHQGDAYGGLVTMVIPALRWPIRPQ